VSGDKNTAAEFVEYDRTFLQASSRWLRDAEIKRLTLTPDFSDEQQERWFESLSARTDYRIWGILAEGRPVGAAGLKNIDLAESSGEYWGYLGEKECWGRGLGRQIVAFVCDRARSLGLRRIYLRVAADNERAIALYTRTGFEISGEAESMITMRRALA
jgi:RimJ/RimL family protein N-acetyltransferase